MDYQKLKSGISEHLNSAAEDFFVVGYCLRQISENALFMEDGYKNIWEFAKSEYNLSTSSASRFMAINARFSIDGGEHMAEKYIGMGVSKLQEMLGLPDEELEKVTQETTVREIRAMKAAKKEPLSFYGFPATKYPEGSLIAMAGCGNGKYYCFSCSRPCKIRQEKCYCRTAPMGKPFSCTQMDEEKRKEMEAGLYRDTCQHLHPELAPVLEGDKEPDPCCLTCENKTCYSRCDVAKAEDEEAKKKAQQESEAKKPEPSNAEIKAFYDWEAFEPTDSLNANDLKAKFCNAYGSFTNFRYQGSRRGIRINYKKEITWAQLAKRLKAIQEQERKAEEVHDCDEKQQVAKEPQEPDVIDADFREVENEPKPEDQEEPEVLCETCEHEGECVGKKTIEYGCMGYEERSEDEDLLCDDCINASSLTGNPDLCANCCTDGKNYIQLQMENEKPDPESYTANDVRQHLWKQEDTLKEYREVGGLPEWTMKNQRILVDALTFLLKKIEKEGAEADEP